MCCANNEKRKTPNDRMNRTIKSRQNQNARRKRNLHGILEAETIKEAEIKGKKL